MGISEADQKKIEELREKAKHDLTQYYDTDYNLLRWLKGHDYNLDVILPKLSNHCQFRKSDWNLDELADKPRNHVIHNHWKSGLTGEAIKTPNTIVNIEQTGSNDYWGMLNSYSTNEILSARVHDLESMLRSVMQLEKKTGEQCSILYIMDLSGLKMDRRLTVLLSGGLAAISSFMAEHYVELIHSFVLVNVPTFISMIWSVAKPLLPERTRNKVNILGSNWREEILKLADPSCLPSYWNIEGQDGPFLAPVERGVAFPVEGYYKGSVPQDAQLLSVPAGKSLYVDIEADEKDEISWEIHASGHFAFCIFYLGETQKDSFDVKTLERFYPWFSKIPGPTLVPCVDSRRTEKKGFYRFWFGNEHAWIHTLKIHHVIKKNSL